MISDRFNKYTYNYLLETALSKVPDTVDKRQGSIIYDAIAPACYVLAQFYAEASELTRNFSLQTASDDYLTELCSQYGTYRNEATYPVLKATSASSIPIGSRFTDKTFNYTVLELISSGVYKIQCETAGTAANNYSGLLYPISNVSVNDLTITEVLIYGRDTETDDELRARHKVNLSTGVQSGNSAQYLSWALNYPGVGAAKVFPLWNGGNTVKIAITNTNKTPATTALVDSFQAYIDPSAEGKGNGVAPLGAKVTISGGTQKNISVAATLVLNSGYTAAEGVQEAVVEYLKSIVYNKASVSYMRLAVAILDCPSVSDMSQFTINSQTADVALTDDEIPVLTSINLTVA
jgi:uncharacterized phage protein gp47/JayE